MRGSLISRMRRVAHSRTAAKVIAASAAGSLVVAAAASGAITAAATPPSKQSMMDAALYAQTLGTVPVADSSSDKLSVTVGKAVSITTDSAGIPSLEAFVLNTQVSGKGSGQLIVPVGTASPTNTGGFGGLKTQGDSIVYDLNSSSSQVQNLHASGGTYKGQDAVSLKVEAWVDGKQYDPTKLFNVSGNVKVNYILQNHTSREQTVTYKNTKGEMATAKVSIPVPFGASFSTTYGDGWGDIQASWAQTGISPTGQQLNGTAILFPPLGGVTQTLTVEARARNATLPNATISAIPINLGTYSGGLILGAANAITGLGQQGASLVARLPSLLLFFQQLLNKYSSIIANVDNQYVQPLLDTVTSVTGAFDPAKLNKTLDTASTELTDFASLMQLNVLIDQVNKNFMSDIAGLLDNGIPNQLNKLADTVGNLGPFIGRMETLVQQILDIFTPLPGGTTLDQVNADLGKIDVACDKVVPTDKYYLPAPEGDHGGAGQTDLHNARAKFLDPFGGHFSLEKFGLMNDLLHAIEGPAVPDITNIPTGQAGLPALIPPSVSVGYYWFNGLTLGGFHVPGCGGIFDVVSPLIHAMTTQVVPELQKILAFMPVIEDVLVPAISKQIKLMANATKGYSKIFDNPKCPNTVKGLVDAGIAGILKNCGLAQAFGLLGKVNQLIVTVVKDDLVPGISLAKKYIPDLKKYADIINKDAPLLGKAVASVPAQMDQYAALLGGFMPTADQLGVTVNDAVDQIAILDASLLAMNKRAADGDGAPYGNATGAGEPVTVAAWQINMNGAGQPYKADAVNLALAVILLLLSAGVGTVLYLRRPH